MKRVVFVISFVLTAIIIQAQHTNIVIGTQYWPEEPTIMIDPLNTNRIVAAANLASMYYSDDGGLTWTMDQLQSPYGVWGDPCIIVDTAGDFYFFHLSNPQNGNWIDRIVCQKTTDGGQTWSTGTYMGLNGDKAQDKEWAIVDRANNNIYVTWSQFDDYGSTIPGDSSNIMFSRSFDGGQTWDSAIRINEVAGDCIDSDSTTEGAVPAVGPNGEIYVAWSGPAGIVFDRSPDSGQTWLEKDVFVTDHPGGWDFYIPGHSRCNGLPVTVCDLSGGAFHGSIYINWCEQNPQDTNDTDVMLIKSTDGGNTWGQPIRVNDDPPGKHQYFTWMAVDQTNGFLYFVFYDRRNDSLNQTATDVFMAVSKDGGNSFTNFKISESPFIPDSTIFFGDYTNIAAHNDVVRPIWARLHNGQLSILTALVDVNALGMDQQEVIDANSLRTYPNPMGNKGYFAFKLHQSSEISLIIYDMQGKEVAVILDKTLRPAGKYVESFNPQAYSLQSGMYTISLEAYGEKMKSKVLVVE